MSVPLEQGYGGGEVPLMEATERNIGLNLKATELRLGLPGSESPERENGGLSMLKCLVSGAKRGFSDAIDGGSGKWVVSGNGGSEVGLCKDGNLFSPKGKNGVGVGVECNSQQNLFSGTVVKETVPHSPKTLHENNKPHISPPSAKAQVVGWPPIRSFRKNSMVSPPQKNDADAEAKSECLYVKVSMEGAPYLRKVDLNGFSSYRELSSALEKMFSCFTISQCGSYGVSSQEKTLSESRLVDLLHGSEYVLTYEDKDGDWMLVGDVPWEMFTESCKRLRIMKSSEAIGLAPRAMEKCKSRN